jgi:hypothetical protein
MIEAMFSEVFWKKEGKSYRRFRHGLRRRDRRVLLRSRQLSIFLQRFALVRNYFSRMRAHR